MSLLEVGSEINRGFVELHRAVFAGGALDRKTEELIALAVSLSTGCGD